MSWNNKINTIHHEESYFVKIYKNNETAIAHLKGNQNPYTHLHLKSCSINKKNCLQVLRFSQLYGLRFRSSGMLLCHWVISNSRTTIPLKMRPLCSFEILWTNYPVMQCRIWEEQNPQNSSFAAQIYNVDFPHPKHKSHLKIKEKDLSSSFWKTYNHSDDQDVWNVSFFLIRIFARHFKNFSSMNGFIARIFQIWISLTL
jgi:hypothetical protein